MSRSLTFPTTGVNRECSFTPKVSLKIPSCCLEVRGRRNKEEELPSNQFGFLFVDFIFFLRSGMLIPYSKSIYKHLLASQRGSRRRFENDNASAPHSDLLLISFLIPVIALSGGQIQSRSWFQLSLSLVRWMGHDSIIVKR